MAVSYQQQALVRKVAYAGLIVVLFTVSLLHRRFVVEPQGNLLQLREVSKGEVNVMESAVRLALTGSRGIAVTFLWSTAIDKQKRHEWNELDLLVSTITKLQPHFITPWLFQSWNLAFNVAVECDRPRDKYYWVSRGVDVLAEGERRNYKSPAPGNPDMRHDIGSYYQLKIGNSDEKNTMRCLLEMSCIDPLDRAPDRLWVDTERGKKVKLDKFKDFCVQNPRLVRRLHDQLKIAAPEDIVRFLEENKDIPSRFEPPTGGPQQKDSPLKEELEQFPILPPGQPAAKSRELSTTELVDVFFVSRKWYEYAQEPLPEPNPDPTNVLPPNPLVERLPRYIATVIFRGYPARAQAYIAENVEAEGWFDADGWTIKKWFDSQRGPNDPEPRVGTDPKFYAAPAWEAAYQLYLKYGTRNGLYLTPTEQAELTRTAQEYRRKYSVTEGEYGEVVLRPGDPGYESFRAHNRLIYTGINQGMTNFQMYLTQTDAERAPETVLARKYLYNAERFRKSYDPEGAIALYQKAWQLWGQVLLAHPKFARIASINEDLYEIQVPYNFYVQKHRTEEFKNLLLGMAQLAVWPYPPLSELLKSSPSDLVQIIPVRNSRGILEYLMYYDGPDARELKMALTAWTQAALQGMHVVGPAQVDLALSRQITRDTPIPPNWRTFVDEETATRVRDRLGLNRSEKSQPAAKTTRKSRR